jgi:hypothetical protein
MGVWGQPGLHSEFLSHQKNEWFCSVEEVLPGEGKGLSLVQHQKKKKATISARIKSILISKCIVLGTKNMWWIKKKSLTNAAGETA